MSRSSNPARPRLGYAPPRAWRPLLNPALRRLWRDDTTLQLGVDCPVTTVLTGLDDDARFTLGLLDGRHTLDDIDRRLTAEGRDSETLEPLLGELSEAGVLGSGPTTAPGPAAETPGVRARLGPDRAALSLLPGGLPAADLAMARRRAAHVVVHGSPRVAAPLAALLAAAGVGGIHVAESGSVALTDAAPGGLLPRDEQRPRRSAAADAVRRAAPGTDTGLRPVDRPALSVLCDPWPDPAQLQMLAASRTVHLAVGVWETTALIGPMVVPGVTACLGCLERHRADRDPGWVPLHAQLVAAPRRGGDACDVALAVLAASFGALHALQHLDTGGVPAAVAGARLELRRPGSRIRRRSWPPHPRCCADPAARPAPGRVGEG